MRHVYPFIVALLSMTLFLGACGGSTSDEGSAKSSDANSKQTLQALPDDCVLVNFPDDTGADDYGERQEAFYAALEEALHNKAEKICIRNSLPLEVMRLYDLDHGIFWVKDFTPGARMWVQLDSDEEKTDYQFYDFEYYDLSREEIDAMKREIDDAADRILAKIPSGADDWTTAKVIHDELCGLVTYDHTQEKAHARDLYGALVNHEAMCSGYSIAFKYLINKAGYSSTTSYSEDHAWNSVGVLSYDRYIDTTWDDTDQFDKNGKPYIFDDYFFLKREEVTSIDSHAIVSGDPYLNYVNETVPYNYHAHEGYLADSYDIGAITEMFRRQKDAGANVLTVRFANDADYQAALAWSDGGSDIGTLLGNIGYAGSYYFWNNDNVKVINIGLYPAE